MYNPRALPRPLTKPVRNILDLVGNTPVPLTGKDGVYSGEVMLTPNNVGIVAEFADQPNMVAILVGYKAE